MNRIASSVYSESIFSLLLDRFVNCYKDLLLVWEAVVMVNRCFVSCFWYIVTELTAQQPLISVFKSLYLTNKDCWLVNWFDCLLMFWCKSILFYCERALNLAWKKQNITLPGKQPASSWIDFSPTPGEQL